MTLEVRGRRTGRTVSLPVVVADYGGARYLVSMLGENANWVRNVRAANGRRGLEAARREVDPITREELDRIVGVWVDAAMKLTSRDLKMMERLVRAQQRNAEEAVESGRESNVVRLEAVGAGD